jgi:hypothetical protein
MDCMSSSSHLVDRRILGRFLGLLRRCPSWPAARVQSRFSSSARWAWWARARWHPRPADPWTRRGWPDSRAARARLQRRPWNTDRRPGDAIGEANGLRVAIAWHGSASRMGDGRQARLPPRRTSITAITGGKLKVFFCRSPCKAPARQAPSAMKIAIEIVRAACARRGSSAVDVGHVEVQPVAGRDEQPGAAGQAPNVLLALQAPAARRRGRCPPPRCWAWKSSIRCGCA